MTTTELALIPQPVSLELQMGAFALPTGAQIAADGLHQEAAGWLAAFLPGARVTTGETSFDTPPVLRLRGAPDGQSLADGAYVLEVTPQGIDIQAATAAGGFYGVQTLRQLLPAGLENGSAPAPWSIPCLVIRDAPRYGWRGFMLDESRHFQGKESVLRLLDLMALLKLNLFHWHLTDDQGWRIEIKRYPRLAEAGGKRKASPFGQRFALGDEHGGFYTQEEIREVVAYAASRHITVMPEIEMPGHAQAAIAAYPDLGCTGAKVEVGTRAGIIEEIFCAGKESTYTFLQGVLEEVLDLFPGAWVHTGGDEVPKGHWQKCPHCQERIRLLGLRDEDGLQEYFTDRMAAWLEEHGRKPVAWAGGWHSVPPKRGVAQFWLAAPSMLASHLETGREAVASGHPAAYLDMKYVIAPLEVSYRYNPLPEGVSSSGLLGVEAPLWTEWVKTPERLDYQVFPRLLAFAEKGWNGEHSDYAAFRGRAVDFLPRLDALGVKYAAEKEWDPPMAAQWLAKVALKVFWARLQREAAKKAAVEGTSPEIF